ncbi:MAG TPA: MFS transporter [Gaiellaceae bacterium]|nr:MFS transporter [Gaiellaceae bacterium]
MNAPRHTTLLSVLKAAAAKHHGGTTAAPRASTAPTRRHEHRPDGRTSSARNGGVVLLFVLLIAQLMVILDITAVNIALPSLAEDLRLSGSQVSWTITSYSLVFGSLLLFGGRAADLLGRRRLFLTGLGVFTTASLASALAGTATALFAARAGQGLGAAMLSPAALAIITTCFHGHAKAKALAAWGAVGGAGAAVGVLAGGLLTEFADWRMIFFVNLPVAVALSITAVKVIPADVEKPRWRGLDLRGAIVATTSLGAIVYAITQGSSAGWTSAQTLGFALAGLVGLTAFAVVETHTEAPLLTISRLRERAVGGGLFLMLAAAGSIFGLFYLCSVYLQDVLGTSPLKTGLAFIPLALAAGVGAHAAGHVVGRHGVRVPLASAFAIAAVGMGLLAHVGADSTYLRNVLPGMLVAGFGLGIAVVSVSIAILTGARENESGMISGLNSTGHEIGGTIGIAIFSTIAAGSGVLAGPQAAAGISHAFIAAAVLASVAALVSLAVLPKARHFVAKLQLNPHAMPVH